MIHEVLPREAWPQHGHVTDAERCRLGKVRCNHVVEIPLTFRWIDGTKSTDCPWIDDVKTAVGSSPVRAGLGITGASSPERTNSANQSGAIFGIRIVSEKVLE